MISACTKPPGCRQGSWHEARQGRDNLAAMCTAGHAKGTQGRQGKAKACADDLALFLASLRAEGVTTLRDLADAVNAREIPTARGGTWSAV